MYFFDDFDLKIISRWDYINVDKMTMILLQSWSLHNMIIAGRGDLPTTALEKIFVVSTTETPQDIHGYDGACTQLAWSISAIATMSLVPVITVVNALLIASFVCFRTFHRVTYTLILGQLISDLIYGVYLIFFALYHLRDTRYMFEEDNYKCLALWCIGTSLEHTGLYFYVLITLDRFIAVHCPFWYIKTISMRGTVIAVIATFVFSLIMGCGIQILWHHEHKECSYYKVTTHGYRYILISEYIAVPVVMLVLNIILFTTSMRVIKSGSVKWAHLWDQKKRHEHTERIRSIKLSALMYGVFLICWMPVNFTYPFKNSDPEDAMKIKVVSGLYVWYAMYPLLNAAVIVFSKRQFYRAARLLLTTPPWKWAGSKNDLLEVENRRRRRVIPKIEVWTETRIGLQD